MIGQILLFASLALLAPSAAAMMSFGQKTFGAPVMMGDESMMSEK